MVAPADFLVAAGSALPLPLAHGPCPANDYKACDVHIGVQLDQAGAVTLAWLGALQIASFAKQRADGEWRIFTATFLALADGEQYLDAVFQYLPVSPGTVAKAKLERLLSYLRQPGDAPALPLTRGTDLGNWLERMRHAG